MTRTGAAARPSVEEQTETFVEWARDHSREISLATIAIATIAGAAWLYGRSAETKAGRAAVALAQAEATIAAGRTTEAETELTALVSRYEGTPAGTQGALRLAQVLYDQGKHQEGISRLVAVLDDHGSGPMEVALKQMIAAGYEEAGQPAEAAARYLEAAADTRLEGESNSLKARAARAFALAGNKAEAIRLWEEVLGSGEGPLSNEARIRLGELRTVPAGSSG